MMSREVACSLWGAMTRVFRDTRGASAMIAAIALPGLIGFGALGTETGLWYAIKLRNQSAADAAAISAAVEVLAGKTDIAGDLTPAACEAAAQNGYTGTTPAVIYPYSDGIVSNAVAVTLRQTQGALLASMFLSHVTIATRAVAVIQKLDYLCILALGTSGTDVEVSDSSRLDMPDCSVAADSTSRSAIDLHGSTSWIAAATLVTQGEVSFQGSPIDPAAPPPEFSLTSRPMIGAPSRYFLDPYAGTLTHAFLTGGIPGTSGGAHSWNSTKTISPGLYDKGMSFGPHAVVDMTPGVYYVTNGDFSVVAGATVTCKTCSGAYGVTIILTTTTGATIGNVQISPGATVTLRAPSSGTFSGLLFVQDPLAMSRTIPDNNLKGGTGMNLNGLLYFPHTTVDFDGNPSAACTVLITNQLIIDGNSNFSISGCASAGLTNLPTVNTVALAE